MSCSYYARLVYGVPFDVACKTEIIKTPVTKYDPDTGKPIEKFTETERCFLFGEDITADEGFYGFDGSDWEEEILEPRGLARVYDGASGYGDKVFSVIGIVIDEVDADCYKRKPRVPTHIPEIEYEDNPNHDLTTRLQKAGWKPEYQADFYLCMEISY